ncbi:MAG: acetate kinase [Cyanobacteria bacterium J06634_5]
MKILVLNAGSSSQKSCLYNIEDTLPCELLPDQCNLPELSDPLWEAQIDWLPQEQTAKLKIATSTGEKHLETVPSPTRKKTLSYLLTCLYQGSTKVLSTLDKIDVVGHRVVHGGQTYQTSVPITPDVKATIGRLSSLAPNHNPANLEGIELIEQLLGNAVPQVAVFDTAFHSQIPKAAAIYPGPYDWVSQGIRRYGFHGISHQYCTQRAAQILHRPVDQLRLIVCHLGNGASLSAVKNGKSIDTTMGFTPLDGLMMGTRSGSVDPGILIHLMRQGHSIDALDKLLNQSSGLQGISGVSHDLREIGVAIAQGNLQAQLAQDMYLHRFKSCFGAMLMSLGGVDAIVFTAGVGEHAAEIRAAACESMEFLGVKLDLAENERSPMDRDISTTESAVRVLVIHTQEDGAIAQACWRYLRSLDKR